MRFACAGRQQTTRRPRRPGRRQNRARCGRSPQESPHVCGFCIRATCRPEPAPGVRLFTSLFACEALGDMRSVDASRCHSYTEQQPVDVCARRDRGRSAAERTAREMHGAPRSSYPSAARYRTVQKDLRDFTMGALRRPVRPSAARHAEAEAVGLSSRSARSLQANKGIHVAVGAHGESPGERSSHHRDTAYRVAGRPGPATAARKFLGGCAAISSIAARRRAGRDVLGHLEFSHRVARVHRCFLSSRL